MVHFIVSVGVQLISHGRFHHQGFRQQLPNKHHLKTFYRFFGFN